MAHPNVARVYAAGTTDQGLPYFVMERIEGEPITDYCDARRLTPRQRIELLLPVCHAVQHAHQKGLIHRDLKPSNILVTEFEGRPVPKVIDFGIAKAIGPDIHDHAPFTEAGQVVGTLEYMSPEQTQFQQLDVDTRSDLYSLGVLLYELLAGELPFPRERFRAAALDEKLRIVREEEPPRPSTRLGNSPTRTEVAARRLLDPRRLAAFVRGDLDWIVMCCLEKDRDRRYGSASALALDLQRFLGHEPVAAGQPSATYRARKFLRRYRGLVAAAGLMFVLLAGGVIGTSVGLVKARKAGEEALEASRSAEASAAEATAAEADARAQARRSEAMNEFLVDRVLALARPRDQDGGLGRDATIGEALDAAAVGLEEAFAGMEDIEAGVRTDFARTYVYLGRFVEAEEQYGRAVAISTAGSNPDARIVPALRSALAYARYHRVLLSVAEQEFREVLEHQLSILPDGDPDTLETRNNLGLVLWRRGELDEAEEVCARLWRPTENRTRSRR
jgi:non-specific serine/threonine protein kinase/serine/threonine-protein kinase